jgi:hypothetical protein
MQQAQDLKLSGRVFTLLCDHQAFVQGRARGLAIAPREHQRHPERCLKMHLVDAAAGGIVESE